MSLFNHTHVATSLKRAGLLISFFTITALSAQNLEDVLRYSTDDLNGSARYQALGGAFGALGGDLSAITNNPAGSSVFAFNEAGGTLSVQSFTNDSNFFNENYEADRSSFALDQAGFVLIFINPTNNWDKIAFGFNTQRSNNFNKNLYAQGINDQNGIADYFLPLTQRFNYTAFDLNNSVNNEYSYWGENEGQDAQLAYMALYTDLIRYNEEDDFYFVDDYIGNGSDQYHLLNSRGGQQVYTINFSGRYMEKLSLGINLNIHSIDYTQHKESSDLYLDSNRDTNLKEVDYVQDLTVFGSGISVQLGALFKASEVVRLGLNYTSPTYYEIEEEYSEGLEVLLYNNSYKDIYPNIVNLVRPYNLRTPAILQASMALVFKDAGLLSIDYGKKNYASAKVDDEFSNPYNSLNTAIDNNLDTASFLRAGAEGRIGDFSLRAGYWFEQSPFTNTAIHSDRTGYSLGFGIRFGNGSLDFAYTQQKKDFQQQFYSIGLTDTAAIAQQSGTVAVSYNVRF